MSVKGPGKMMKKAKSQRKIIQVPLTVLIMTKLVDSLPPMLIQDEEVQLTVVAEDLGDSMRNIMTLVF